jgi:RNA polymerase sigma-70 factor (ECF subfamily)
MTLTEFQDQVLPLKNKLYHFAYRLLANAEEAKDTVQDVLVKVWESGKELEEYDNVEAWCMTLTRNRSLDKIKVGNNRSKHLKIISPSRLDHQTPHALLEQSETMRQIVNVTQNLPSVQRELIELRDFQEKSYDEIIEITGLEMSQVKVYLHRARKAVRENILKLHAHGTGK